MRGAFKEWAIIVDALGRGEQIVILRKGGISEGRGGFQLERSQFLLFPTRFHQQRERVQPAAQARYDQISAAFPDPGIVRIEYWAEVVAGRKLDSLEMAERLRGRHIWRDEVIRDRFDWGREKNIHALAVRVRRLAKPVDLPMLEAYGGCKSWIELDGEVSVAGSAPVLSEAGFNEKLGEFQAALENPAAS